MSVKRYFRVFGVKSKKEYKMLKSESESSVALSKVMGLESVFNDLGPEQVNQVRGCDDQ